MIVKMKFLSITGPKADIDRVVNTYLSKYEIHLENALTELSTMQNITPYIQINPYKETLKQAEDFTALLPEDKRTTTKRLSLEDAINCVHGLDHTLGQLNQERTELEAKKKALKILQNPCQVLLLLNTVLMKMKIIQEETHHQLIIH